MASRLLTVAVGLGLVVSLARAQTTQPALGPFDGSGRVTQEQVRVHFEQIERIARLPEAERNLQVTRLYREALVPMSSSARIALMASSRATGPRLLTQDRLGAGITADYGAELESVASTMSIQEVFDLAVASQGIVALHQATLERLKWVLLRQPEQLKRLIDADLSADDTSARRALTAINQMKLRDYSDQLMGILIVGGPRAADAATALDFIRNDPAAAKPLIADVEKNPANINRYKYLLRVMLSNQESDAVLVRLLDHPDARIRESAAIVLEEAENNSAVVLIPQLLGDFDLQVRLSGIRKAFRLPADLFPLVRAMVVARLESPDQFERIQVAVSLVRKQDASGAKVLLAALKNPQLPTQLRGPVSSAITQLVSPGPRRGSTVRILPSAAWDPNDPQHRQAVDAFEKWVTENVDAK